MYESMPWHMYVHVCMCNIIYTLYSQQDKENCNPSDNSRPKIKLSNPSSCVSRLIRVTQRKQEQPLPKPFPLPQNFPPVVAMGLEKRSLAGKARTKFVTTLANAIFMHKSYPSTSELRDVIRIAHQKWDFLAAATGDVSQFGIMMF